MIIDQEAAGSVIGEVKQRNRWISVFKMKITRAQNTGSAQVVPKKRNGLCLHGASKSTSLLQIPIQHYATVNLMTEVPPKNSY